MLMQLSTWREVEAYLGRSRGIVIPLGSTEQHGPVGLIGTDALCAEAVASELGTEQDVLVAPALAWAPAQFNLAFPGTLSVRTATLMALVTDVVRSLVAQGFRRFYFLNGHGANAAPVRAAVQDLYAEYSVAAQPAPLRCRLRSWWEYPAVDRLRRELYGEAEGMHATPSEIAIVQHVLGRARDADAPPAPALLSRAWLRDHAGDNHDDAAAHRSAFPDGRVGSDSGLARPEDGQRLFRAAVDGAWEDYQAFLAEASGLPG